MFSQTVKHPDGTMRQVTAKTEDELKKAVADVKKLKPATYPNINVPVEKGHDLVEVDDAMNVNLVDGTGAHNSPRDAIRDGGKLEGDKDVASPGAGEAPRREANTGNPVGDPTVQEPKERKS